MVFVRFLKKTVNFTRSCALAQKAKFYALKMLKINISRILMLPSWPHCLYMLPLSAILRFHKIGYHVYADDTQIYVSFKCDDPSQALDKINVCISDIRK